MGGDFSFTMEIRDGPVGPVGATWQRWHAGATPVTCTHCDGPADMLDFIDMDEAKFDLARHPHRPFIWVVQPHGKCPAYEVDHLEYLDKGGKKAERPKAIEAK